MVFISGNLIFYEKFLWKVKQPDNWRNMEKKN